MNPKQAVPNSFTIPATNPKFATVEAPVL